MSQSSLKKFATSRVGAVAGAAALVAVATAAWVQMRARRAERHHPPRGSFIDVDGVRLHCFERGQGPAVVLIHGNTVTLDDFVASGLVERLARQHRVIVIDRPGFGHSTRPRDRLWTPAAQAKVIHAALGALGIVRPVVVGHSMGTLVALALALDHPDDVSRLVLLSGYYYPTLRLDALLTAPVALPVLGDAMRYTVTAVASRVMLDGAVKAMFAPNAVPPDFYSVLSREIMVRPVQLRANAEDASFMMPAVVGLSKRYGELQMPVAVFAGAGDLVVDPRAHAERLYGELADGSLSVLPAIGHMVHYSAGEQIAAAIEA